MSKYNIMVDLSNIYRYIYVNTNSIHHRVLVTGELYAEDRIAHYRTTMKDMFFSIILLIPSLEYSIEHRLIIT